MWYARPQLFFTRALRPKNVRKPKNANYKTGPDDKVYSFVFFSTFEVLDLPIKLDDQRAYGGRWSDQMV